MGYCVLWAINKIATTVPFNLINNKNIENVNTILIYNQWGWERSQEKIDELKNIFKNIILDRVDTLIDYKNKTNHYKNVNCEIFSLTKTLGLGGGGLLWINNKYHEFLDSLCVPPKTHEEELVLNKIDNIDYLNFYFIDHLLKNNFQSYSKRLKYNLENNDIDKNIIFEMKSRREKLNLLINSFPNSLPDWMIKKSKDNNTLPGIFPLKIKKEYYNLILNDLENKFNLKTRILNFNFSDNYLVYKWEEVLPIPLHSSLSDEVLSRIIKYLKKYV